MVDANSRLTEQLEALTKAVQLYEAKAAELQAHRDAIPYESEMELATLLAEERTLHQGTWRVLEDLVTAYNACFDPDKKMSAHELGVALENAEDHLSVLQAESEVGVRWEEVKAKAGLR